MFQLPFHLNPEARVLRVDHDALASRVEFDLDFVVLLQPAGGGLDGLGYQREEIIIFDFGEAASVEI